MPEDPDRRVSADRLTEVGVELLVAAGAPDEEARIVSTSLTRAEMRGQGSHGFIRLPTYVKRMQAGLIRVGVPLTLVHESTVGQTFDAGAAFGHVAATRAMDACIDRARSTGIAIAVIRNSTHFGVAGLFAEQAAAQDMIGVTMSNGAPRMAPHGGSKAVLGTNPLAFAVPTRLGYPLVLDMATSVAALGKIVEAQSKGSAIPDGWALGPDGAPTTDASAAMAGVLLPMAGAKGSGLALILEILSAILSGSSFGPNAGSMYRTWDRPENLGHLVGAIALDAFTSADRFHRDLAELITQITAGSGDPSKPVLLPGEIEARREAETTASGIDLGANVVSALDEAAVLAGIPSIGARL